MLRLSFEMMKQTSQKHFHEKTASILIAPQNKKTNKIRLRIAREHFGSNAWQGIFMDD